MSTSDPPATADSPIDVQALLQHVDRLPPLPAAASKALGLLRDPDVDMGDLAAVLELDAALAGLVLRWVNSAYYGPTHRISTVQQAVVYLGMDSLRNLILSAAAASVLDRPLPGYGLAYGDLWKHSLAVATGAELAAQPWGRELAADAYHAGLLHDIGKLALDTVIRRRVHPADYSNQSFQEQERQWLGIDHAKLGGEIARRWKLPPILVEAVTYHHQPSQAPENVWAVTCAVHVADAVALMLGYGLGYAGLYYPVDPAALARVGWTEATLGEVADKISTVVGEAENWLYSSRGDL